MEAPQRTKYISGTEMFNAYNSLHKISFHYENFKLHQRPLQALYQIHQIKWTLS